MSSLLSAPIVHRPKQLIIPLFNNLEIDAYCIKNEYYFFAPSFKPHSE